MDLRQHENIELDNQTMKILAEQYISKLEQEFEHIISCNFNPHTVRFCNFMCLCLSSYRWFIKVLEEYKEKKSDDK